MVTTFAILKLAVWNEVHAIRKVSVSEEAVNNFMGVTIPELVISGHPLGDRSVLWIEAIVACSV